MSLVSVIRRDVLSKFAGELGARFVFLFFFFYVARKLSPEDFGSLNLALSTAIIIGVLFLDPGLNLSAIRLLIAGEHERSRTAGVILSFKLLLLLPMLCVLCALALVFRGRLPSLSLLLLAALFVFFTALLDYLSSVTNAFHRMDIEALLKISNRCALVAFGVVALRLGRIAPLLGAMSIATASSCVLGLVLVKRHCLPMRLRWDPNLVKKALALGLPVAGTMIVTAVYLKWDLLVLSYFNIGRQELGWYAGAFKILEACSAIPSLLGAALFPLVVQLLAEKSDALARLLQTSTKVVLLVSIPAAAGISLFSRSVISLAYGEKYMPGAGVLSVLIWCIVPIFLYFYLVFVNVATGHAKRNLVAACATLIVGLAANAVLVPRIGFIGAAWSALLANSTFAVLATWNVCRAFPGVGLPSILLRLLTAGGLFMVVIALVPASPIVRFLLGLLVYFAALVGLRILSADDVSLATRVAQLHGQPQPQEP
jgi:O-antigen/teichoic acid export membrane protein